MEPRDVDSRKAGGRRRGGRAGGKRGRDRSEDDHACAKYDQGRATFADNPKREGCALVSLTSETLGNAIADPLLIADPGGRVLFMNAPALDAFGYASEDVASLSATTLLPGFPATCELGTLELEARRKDGSGFPAHVSCTTTAFGDQELCFGLVHDLTEQRRSEEELRRTRDQLLEAQTLARIGSWEWDIGANEVTWSDELYRIYGLEPNEVVPSYEGFLERVHPDDRESVDARNRKAFADHQPFEDVKRCVRPGGTVFLMRTQGQVITDEQGNPIRMLGVCEDVTADKDAERVQAELAAIVESSQDAIIARSLTGEITSWNRGAAKLFGYTAKEAIGADVGMLIPPELRAEYDEIVERLIRGETVEPFETRRRKRDGSLVDVSLGMSPVGDADGEMVAISIIARDVTERKRFEAQLKRLADHDPLTGLFNRRRFEEELDAGLARLKRFGVSAALLILDLDGFKYVNDALGHGAGDQLLTGVARLLRERVRPSDVLARIGGDEFAVLLPTADEDSARSVATDLLQGLRELAVELEGRPIGVTASIGVVCFGREATSEEELIAEADRAMYFAKDSGRDRAQLVLPGDREAGGKAELGWEHRIRTALEEDRFVLHSQPIIDVQTGEPVQHELLLRMEDGDELVPPSAFLPVAERLGLIQAIDRWVVGEALRMMSERPDLRLEVNLSALSIDDELLLAQIRDGLAGYSVDPSHLILEITETAAIGNIDVARRFAAGLHELGCSLALDDFGTGFGSFYYLKHLPAAYLKIDGDFVSSPRSQTDELVIESIVRIAKGLGKRAIAEHVEDGQTLDAMRRMGVDYAQGFHVGRPQPVARLMFASAG
ncbi:MAG: EAL domain-containing protein [Solirubrobacterales bacterium]